MKSTAVMTLLTSAVVGFLMGLLAGGWSVLPDFLHRLRWSWSGGGGETADWGEPLFYFLVMGVPVGVLGCLGALVLSAVILLIVSRIK